MKINEEKTDFSIQLHHDMTTKEYPTAFFIWPSIKQNKGFLKSLKDRVTSAFVDSMDIYCLCEFQSRPMKSGEIDADADVEPMWHPVEGFFTTIKKPTELLNNMATAIRVTRHVLKYGSAISRLAGFPIPDISEVLNVNLDKGVADIITTVWGDVVGSKAFNDGTELLEKKDGLKLIKDKVPKQIDFTREQFIKIKEAFPEIEPIVCLITQSSCSQLVIYFQRGSVGKLSKVIIKPNCPFYSPSMSVLWLCKAHEDIYKKWEADENSQKAVESGKQECKKAWNKDQFVTSEEESGFGFDD